MERLIQKLMKHYLLFIALITAVLAANAQKVILSVGNSTALTIKTGTTFSADSLVLVPGSDFTLGANMIQVSPVAVSLTPIPSINRVYYLSSPVSFTGAIQLYYQPSELNGNTESTLEYTDSAMSGAWAAESTSSVNTSLHFVQFNPAGQSFIGATGSGPIITLPLSLLSFNGNWNQEEPALEWVVEQTNETVSFDVESSTDGETWKQIGTITGQDGNGMDTYQFVDGHPSSDNMYYRIKLVLASGHSSYSYIINLQNGKTDNNVRIIPGNSAVSVHFLGQRPTWVRVVNVSGQTFLNDAAPQQEYDLNGLFPGVYFLQYELNGKGGVRKFVVQ
jgi:hypothetical protein